MRAIRNLTLTVTVCAVVVLLKVAFILMPVAGLVQFNMVFRPLVFAVLAALTFALMGVDARSVRGAYAVNLMAVLSVGMLGMAFLIFSLLFGIIINPMAPSPAVILNNFWNPGAAVALSAYIQYRLIKNADKQQQANAVAVLTMIFALIYMGGMRVLADGGSMSAEIFFVSIFRPLVISAAVSYFATRGSFLSVVLVNAPYAMILYFLPFIPDVSAVTLALLISGALFISVIICHFVTNEKSRAVRVREKRLARYAKKPVLGYVSLAGGIITIIAFFAGAFTIYPVVVLTGSMEPTLARGSLALVERVPPGEAFERVGEGYVIHFTSNGVPFIHRVVAHWYDPQGRRHYITQGDAGYGPDPFPVPPDDVRGIARATLPFLGYPYIFFWSVIRAFG